MSKSLDSLAGGGTGRLSKSVHSSRQLLKESSRLEPSHQYSVQFVRSIAVSIVAVIVNFGGSYIFKQKMGMYYLLAAGLSFFLGVVVNYYLSVKWVFATRKLASKHAEFIIFVVITSIGLMLNLLIIAAMVEIVKVGYWMALVVATIIVFFWNFLARKKVLY
jgi:putative flippase GtrA